MPHVNIKHLPKDLTPEQRQDLAEAITEAITRHFDVPDGAVSIAVEPVAASEWTAAVYEPEIATRDHLLIKRPQYGDG